MSILVPETVTWYNRNKSDRLLMKNVATLRNKIKEITEERKKGLNKSSFEEGNNLLHILLTDDLFKDDFEAICDKTITFFIAGNQTTAFTTANMLMFF